ncbi:MAG: helix-turn-helix domain-containing protein [Polyangiaceae bacterium]
MPPLPGPAGRVLVAVGGGRGGVGKSLVAVNVAVYLAQLGKRVVLVDADPNGSNLHTHFGLRAAKVDPWLDEREGSLEGALLGTLVPGLSILPAPHDAIANAPVLRGGRKRRWLTRVRALPGDFVVVDVGAGHGGFAADVLLSADVPVLVTVPEPPAVEATYRVLRHAFRRRLRRALLRDRFRSTLLGRYLHESGQVPSPRALMAAVVKSDRLLAETALAEAEAMPMQLVVNQTRVRSDVELGGQMSDLVRRHYALHVDELGHVEHDDTVWLTVRRERPLLVDSPTCRAARNLERIARRVLALGTTRVTRPRLPSPITAEGASLYDVLGVIRTANDEDIRRAYKKLKEVYAGGSLATVSFFEDVERRAAQGSLEEAYDTLLDPVRRRAYDLSTFPDDDARHGAAPRDKPALAAEHRMLQAELAREIGPETEFSGDLLRKVRESQGVELAEICGKTKIAKAHLAAIEDERFDLLPPAVYVRGFVWELAKFLKLDPAQVQKTYLARMRGSEAAKDRE